VTIAETHGKISSTGRNLHNQMEDLLTSDVFSACKYLRPSTLLLPFLSTAISLDGRNLKDILPADANSVKFCFWPMLSNGEPDIAILIEDHKRKLHLVVVEAKYLSGKSSVALDEEELETATAPSDQLAGEYEDLLTLEHQLSFGSKEIASRSLFYVTAHRSIPIDSLNESMREVARFHPDLPAGPIFWTSWFYLIPLLMRAERDESWEKPILSDFQALLMRKGFIQFRGFDFVESIKFNNEKAFYAVFGVRTGGSYDWTVSHLAPITWFGSYHSGGSRSYFESLMKPLRVEPFYLPGERE